MIGNRLTVSPSHRVKELYRWNKHVAPFFGETPVGEITRKQVKHRLRDIQGDSIDTARRVQSLLDQVFCFAEISDDIDENPIVGLSRILKKHKHYPKITDPDKLGPVSRTQYLVLACKLLHLLGFVTPVFDSLNGASWTSLKRYGPFLRIG